MFGPISHTRLLRYAGLFTWGMVGVPLVYSQYVPAYGPEEPGLGRVGGAMLFACYLGFGACYWWLTRGLANARPSWHDRALLLVLTLFGLAVSYFNGSGLGSILLMVAAGVIPWMLPATSGVLLLLVSQLAVLPIYYGVFRMPLFEALMQSLLYGGFSLFIYVTSLVARQQAQARDEQRRLNAELRATRALLAESARVNERTRISRELHDLLGHHLTALSLNLEVASHMTEGRAQEHVRQANTLARLLLTDVREAVSQLRDASGGIDLATALRPLADHVPSLDVDLDIQAPLAIDDPERAHVVLRCTQEIITNAVRHASGASRLHIRVWREDGAIRLEARDNGEGADGVVPGNGLRGMHERVQQCGGTLDIQTRKGAGFVLRLSIPASAPARPAIEGALP
ncbi:integral membrane sensor signal transduction histidine kinase [Pseudoxanthomonas suwonensis 11-1]|uniref:Integral membrane sensor signal transduction histidine kinase n=1 Tax=Pseudoxanthomonas suwonensis (strain 11-1) TaxID=743721 RepID=E6WUY4_PSEUU|nr:sensor histidine kinase [Pseudoxanthomonas suwonensis]ADV27983.1 integral membrane sensor signal transduction histidine kinase [Pseudoxanthomonas suwonensis 11-1]